MTLDELVLEWSYRTQRGYPKLDNPSDVLILKQILTELNLPTDNLLKNLKEMPSYLSKGELEKYKDNPSKDRISILIKKIENDEELTLKDGGTFVVANKEDAINDLMGDIPKFGVELIDKDGNKIKTSDIQKTPEFGGADKVSTDPENLKVRTDTKESLVILMCNILSNGSNLKPFNTKSFIDNINIIKSFSNKYKDIESEIQGYIETLLDLVENYENLSTKSKRKSEAIFNNPYSIAVEILKTYPKPRFNRGEIFNKIRTECSRITVLEKDKWNPGDIYLVNFEPELPIETDSIAPWNDLFVNNWGDTDKPLVSITLKEEKYQPGRAKSYLTKFGDKVEYDLSKEELEWDEENYKSEITRLREIVSKLIEDGGTGSPNEVIKRGDGWEGKFSEGRAKLQGTYGAYKLLEFILKHPEASIAGLFAYGQSIPGDPSANPTFFKLVGGNKGELKAIEKYPGGSNTDLTKDEPVIITDTTKSANITISGKLDIIKDGEIERTEDVSKTFRGDYGRAVGIV